MSIKRLFFVLGSTVVLSACEPDAGQGLPDLESEQQDNVDSTQLHSTRGVVNFFVIGRNAYDTRPDSIPQPAEVELADPRDVLGPGQEAPFGRAAIGYVSGGGGFNIITGDDCGLRIGSDYWSTPQTCGNPARPRAIFLAAGDFDGDSRDDVAVSVSDGRILVYNSLAFFNPAATTTPLVAGSSFKAYASGRARIAAGDVNGDGVDELLTIPGPGTQPRLKVFRSPDFQMVGSICVWGDCVSNYWLGGGFVGTGDTDLDGNVEIIVGPDTGSVVTTIPLRVPTPAQSPRTKLYDSDVYQPRQRWSMHPYGTGYLGGVRVGMGRYPRFRDSPAKPFVVTAPGAGRGPIKIFLAADGSYSTYVDVGEFGAGYTGGYYIAGK